MGMGLLSRQGLLDSPRETHQLQDDFLGGFFGWLVVALNVPFVLIVEEFRGGLDRGCVLSSPAVRIPVSRLETGEKDQTSAT